MVTRSAASFITVSRSLCASGCSSTKSSGVSPLDPGHPHVEIVSGKRRLAAERKWLRPAPLGEELSARLSA
jgi:hypothetical protein